MNKSESIAQLADALSKAQGEIESAKKDADNPYFKSKYADLASVWAACRTPLSKYGLSVVQMPEFRDGQIITHTLLMHSSGEWISGELAMTPVKGDPQALGSAITYGRRYALSAAVGIAPEDDDGNAASDKVKGAERTSAPLQVSSPRTQRVPDNSPVKGKTEPAKAAKPVGGSLEPPDGNYMPALADAVAKTAAMPDTFDALSKETNPFRGREPGSDDEAEIGGVETIAGDEGRIKNFARAFRESLPKTRQKEQDVLRHEWLSMKLLINKDGNPDSVMIPKAEFEKLKAEACDWAKEQAK